MSFKMKFEALQPIGYGDYESGLAEGRKQGIEQGKVIGVQEGVAQTNAEVLLLTGTEQSTATQAIAEINATLATNLTAKGVEAQPTETTLELSEKVKNVPSYDDGYNDGLNAGAGAADAILDGTAFASGEYTNNTVKELRDSAFNGTGLKKLYLQEVETIRGSLIGENTSLSYVSMPKLKKIDRAFMLCRALVGDWSFLEQLECVGALAFRACILPESITFSNLTEYLSANSSPFYDVYTVKHLIFPRLQVYPDRFIQAMANIETIECGSVGYPVTSMHANTFGGTTSITSITVYCEDTNNPPTGSPWGAPNATVTFLKA